MERASEPPASDVTTAPQPQHSSRLVMTSQFRMMKMLKDDRLFGSDVIYYVPDYLRGTAFVVVSCFNGLRS